MNIIPVVLEMYTALTLFFPPRPFRVRFCLARSAVYLVEHSHDVPVCLNMQSLVLPGFFPNTSTLGKLLYVCLCTVLFSTVSVYVPCSAEYAFEYHLTQYGP